MAIPTKDFVSGFSDGLKQRIAEEIRIIQIQAHKDLQNSIGNVVRDMGVEISHTEQKQLMDSILTNIQFSMPRFP